MRRTTWVGAAGLALLVPTVGVASYSIAQAAESPQTSAVGLVCEHGMQATSTDWAPLTEGEQTDLEPEDAIATYLESRLGALAAESKESTGATKSSGAVAAEAETKAQSFEPVADVEGRPTLRSFDTDPITPTEVTLEPRGDGWAVSTTRTCAPAEGVLR